MLMYMQDLGARVYKTFSYTAAFILEMLTKF